MTKGVKRKGMGNSGSEGAIPFTGHFSDGHKPGRS